MHSIGAIASDAVVTKSAVQTVDSPSTLSASESNETLEIAKDQIETGEYEAAIRLAEREIGRTETILGRYDIALVEPLVVLGDGTATTTTRSTPMTEPST